MILKKKIEKAANKYAKEINISWDECYRNLFEELDIIPFKAGVEFAEKELKDLIISFGEYCSYMTRNLNDNTLTFEELLKRFLKKRKDGN